MKIFLEDIEEINFFQPLSIDRAQLISLGDQKFEKNLVLKCFKPHNHNL